MIALFPRRGGFVLYALLGVAVVHALVTFRLLQHRSALQAALHDVGTDMSEGEVATALARARAERDAIPSDEEGREQATRALALVARWMDEFGIADRSLGLQPPQVTQEFVLTPMELTFTCTPEKGLTFLTKLERELGDLRFARLRIRTVSESETPLVTVFVRIETLAWSKGGGS